MAREISVHDDEWGEYKLFVLREQEDGSWEDEDWNRLRSFESVRPTLELFSHVSWDTFQEALQGYSMPLIKQLQLPPESCLMKANTGVSQCIYFDECPSYNPDECFAHKGPPPCYSPSIAEAEFSIRNTYTKIIEYWEHDRWIIVVPSMLEEPS
jgi:hypothetical protein